MNYSEDERDSFDIFYATDLREVAIELNRLGWHSYDIGWGAVLDEARYYSTSEIETIVDYMIKIELGVSI